MGPSLAENRPKTDPIISDQTAFKYSHVNVSSLMKLPFPLGGRVGTGPRRLSVLGHGHPEPPPDLSWVEEGCEINAQRNPILAVLEAKIKIKNPRIRAGIGPNLRFPSGNHSPDPPPGPPEGGGGAKNKNKNHFKHIQAMYV